MTRKHRPAIGEDPLDAVLGGSATVLRKRPGGRVVPQAPAATGRRVRLTVQVPPGLVEDLRDACYSERLTLTGVAEEALRRELDRLRKAHNAGKPFPPRRGKLRVGRPIGS